MALGLASLAARMHAPSIEEQERADKVRSVLTGVGPDERGRPTPFDDGKFTTFEVAGEGMKFTRAAAGVAREHAGAGLSTLKDGYDTFTNDLSEGLGDRVSAATKFAFHPLTTLRESFRDAQNAPEGDTRNISERIRDDMENVSEAVRNSPGYVRDMAAQASAGIDQMGKESLDAYLNRNYREEGNISNLSGTLATGLASGAEVEAQGPSVADRVSDIQSKQVDQAQAALGDEGMER